MDANFKIRGLNQLNKELKLLPEDLRNKALNGAVGAAARVLRDEAMRNVPVDTGNLKGAIRSQKKKTPSKYIGKHQVNIKPRGRVTILTRGRNRRSSSTYYAKFIEEGSSKTPARPFMRTAFAAKRGDSVKTFQKTLDRRIVLAQKRIKRLAG